MNFIQKASELILNLNIREQSAAQVSAKLGIGGKTEIKEIKRVLETLTRDGKLVYNAENGKYSAIKYSKNAKGGKATANRDNKQNISVKKYDNERADKTENAPELTASDEGVIKIRGNIIDLNKNILTTKSGKTKPIYAGTLRGNKRGFAFLIREDGGDDLFVANSGLHGAQHGDKVACSIVKGDSAKVECLVERGNGRLVGTYIARANDDYGFVVPDGNSYFSDIKVRTKDADGARNNDKVVVEITDYSRTKLVGRITEVIGSASDKQSTVLSILKSYEFYNEFSKPALKEAENMRRQGADNDIKNRKDYRNKLSITIDGDDSKDFDDAVTVERSGKNYLLYVHIADVSHYVQPNGELDKEAFKRCTSVYFPGSVYPMLPEAISNDVCSLIEGADRLTLTCVMEISPSGTVVASEITESVINSTHRMTYANVTAILEGDTALTAEYADVAPMLNDMLRLKEILEKRRIAKGKIDLVSKECKVVLDEKGDVKDIVEYPYTVSNSIIEEFMLIANETVAEFAVKNELPFVYRVHENPDKDKLRALSAFLAGFGQKLTPTDVKPADIQAVLNGLKGEDIEGIVNRVVLRSMQKAKYMTECKGHFGLATEFYCHFTSPIRRYPDLQIHRVLKAFINNKSVAKAKFMIAKCSETAVRSSEREVSAERAERDIDDFYKAEYMSRHIGEEFDGIVSGVTSFGIFVELKNTCEGIIKLDELPKDNYNYIEERFLLKGSKNTFTLGGKVRIKVESVEKLTGRVAFSLVESLN